VVELLPAGGGGIFLKTPYLAEFVEELKDRIPPHGRHWDRVKKMWYVEPSWADDARELVSWYFGTDIAVTAKNEPPEWAKTLYVQENAPIQVVEAAYRALSKLYHPDMGGNATLMQRLNTAVEAARQEKRSCPGR